MTPSIKTHWVEALRSGRYKQGHRYLRDKYDRFCCMGVLCDVVKEDVGGEWKLWEDSTLRTYNFQQQIAYPSKEVYELTQLTVAPVEIGPVTSHLVRLNDGENKSFAEIADWIEENL